jgi:hypothetical protein
MLSSLSRVLFGGIANFDVDVNIWSTAVSGAVGHPVRSAIRRWNRDEACVYSWAFIARIAVTPRPLTA